MLVQCFQNKNKNSVLVSSINGIEEKDKLFVVHFEFFSAFLAQGQVQYSDAHLCSMGPICSWTGPRW